MAWLQRWRRARLNKCRDCGSQLEQTTISRAEGHSGDAVVVLRNIPVLACVDLSHPKRWADPEFGATLTDQLFFTGAVPISRVRGPRLVCWKCGVRLAASNIARIRIEGRVHVGNLPPFEVEVEASGSRCDHCGEQQICASHDVSNDIANGLAKAFQVVSLQP
jgi:hypothetical protein